MEAGYTPLNDIPHAVGDLRTTFNSGHTRSLEWRYTALNAMKRMLTEHINVFTEAIMKDLKRSRFLAKNEVAGLIEETQYMISNLKSLVAPCYTDVPLIQLPASAHIVAEPLGVVLVLSPWNFPIDLALRPVIGAIAAGNCVLLKPSEHSPYSTAAIVHWLPKYMDASAVRIVTGAVPETSLLLEQKFDTIFYTGSTAVGRIVLQAAAKHLTPCILELGGKCPVLVDDDANLELMCQRVCWGKFVLNTGQVCLSPDYVLVSRRIEKKFIATMQRTLDSYFPKGAQSSEDFGRIINKGHLNRLKSLLLPVPRDQILRGGESDDGDLYLAPTLVHSPDLDLALMRDEIFGPILPIIPVDSMDDAIAFVNARPRPLALYYFGGDAGARHVERTTISGALVVNDVFMHVVCHDLPFGGIGDSGMGTYHGAASFKCFSHHKPVLSKPTSSFVVSLTASMEALFRFPPFTLGQLRLADRLAPTVMMPSRAVLRTVLLYSFAVFLALLPVYIAVVGV